MAKSLRRRALVVALGGAAAGCGTTAIRDDSALASEFAPRGRLRACINLGNPILARRGGDGAQPEGVSVDLARELAAQLGVEFEPVVVDAALRAVQAVDAGQADIGFFAVDPGRAEAIHFSAPYLLIEGAYLVRADSALTAIAQVDRPGARIVVGRGSAYDLFLSRELKSAALLRVPTSQAVVDSFVAESADVAAGVRQQLEADAARIGGLRLLPGRFMRIDQAMGVAASRSAAVQSRLDAFVEWAKRSGFVERALQRHRIEGAAVAPPA